MVTRAQIERLSERVEKIASAGDKQLIVVVDPAETNEQALRRNGLPASVGSRSYTTWRIATTMRSYALPTRLRRRHLQASRMRWSA